MDKVIPAPTYPTKEEKLANLVRLTVDELSKTKNVKVKRVLVNQLQAFRRLWEKSKEGE